jgi:signal transduction histidine kinase
MIELSMDQRQLERLTRKLLLAASLLGFLFWITTTSLTFFFLRKVTTTFQLLMSGVKKIESGDLSTRIPTSETDEPGRALAAINSLAEALQKKNEENLRLQAEIVQGLQSEIDDEKNRHMAKLIQTNRMTSLGLLVSSMAHEINNPNGSIRLAAEILEKAWKDVLPILDELSQDEGEFKICGMPYSYASDDIETAVDAILRSSTRIERVVQNLRTYSIGDRESQFTAFDLNRIAENAVAIVRAHGKMENIVITTTLAPLLPAITGNPFQLEQVVINLLLNAIQAKSASGENTITLSTEVNAVKHEVMLAVKDSGPGIKTEDLPHIFEPFFSTRIDEGGSGLGLYISQFLVKEQNGILEIMNNESGGCRAVIRLPVAEAVTLLPSSLLPASC